MQRLRITKPIMSRFNLVKLPSQPNKDAYSQIATKMGRIHNMFISSLNAIYSQAEEPSNDLEKRTYLRYCMQWYMGIHGHHTHEERAFFPRIEEVAKKPGLMAANIQQHEQFHHGLDELWGYVSDSKNVQAYDPKRIKEIIDSFGDVFAAHMNDEIGTLLDLENYVTEEQMLRLWRDLERSVHGG